MQHRDKISRRKTRRAAQTRPTREYQLPVPGNLVSAEQFTAILAGQR